MPQHDIIDNRNEKLIEHILRILPSSERVKFIDQTKNEEYSEKPTQTYKVLGISPNNEFHKNMKMLIR
jgi:hypothetical protein